jgi:Ca2+-binding RTX toxin-like protein
LTGQGVDQINSSLVDFDLPDFVENGRILSTGSADLGGNDLNNTLFAGAGNNDLKGRAGIDTVSYAYGLSGTTGVLVDLQTGLEQNTGGSGLDTLSSIENLIGSARADTLIGNADANTLRGGLGQDSLSGLGGADHFVFDTALALGNRDRVLDFVSGVDKLVLDDDIFTVLSGSVAGTSLPAGFFRVGSAPLDADDYFLYTPNTDVLWYAPSANATINLLPVAVIPMGNLTPLASDFLVIA